MSIGNIGDIVQGVIPLRGADEGVSVWTLSFSDCWGKFT